MAKKINFFRIKNRFLFLLTSRNQHGVHSPFVFNFVTQGLYTKKKKQNSIIGITLPSNLTKKESNILLKIIKYFSIKEISLNKTNTLSKLNKLLIISDLSFIKSIDINDFNKYKCIVIQNIYKSKTDYINWSNLIDKNEITVTIDLFYFGLIFIRKQQAKEHFKIRV